MSLQNKIKQLFTNKCYDHLKSKSINDLLECNVRELNLSVRSANCLFHPIKGRDWSQIEGKYCNVWEIITIKDLIKHTEKELYEIINMGSKSVMEIQATLAEIGLNLGMTEEQISKIKQEQIKDPKYQASLLATETDNAFNKWVEKNKALNKAADKIVSAHKLYQQALEEESIASKELRLARKNLCEYDLK